MCRNCEGPGDPIEVTADNVGHMQHEATAAALQASGASANGWRRGAQGLLVDMLSKWGTPAMIRSAFVWGSAVYFLQPSSESPELGNVGYDMIAEIGREVIGKEPHPSEVSRLVAVNDQAAAVCKDIAKAAAEKDEEEISRLLLKADKDVCRCALSMLLVDSGFRMRHAQENEDDLSMDVFLGHLAEVHDESEGGGCDGHH